MSGNSKEEGLLKPGEIIRPQLVHSDVPELIKRIFGLEVTSIKELKSYDDKNYLVKVSPNNIANDNLRDVSTAGYVLKVMNSMDSKNIQLVDAQSQMMLYLEEKGFKVPTPTKTIEGSYTSLEPLSTEDNIYVVRLLHFLPGKMFFDVTYTASLFYELGEYVARLDNTLEDMKNDAICERKFIWMMSSVPELSRFIYVLKDEHKLSMIKEILSIWDSCVAPHLSTFKKGIIHGDINEQNILVKPDDKNPSEYHVDGLIDFGDISYSCYVFELAIAITYMMIEVKSMPPIDVGGHLLAGYLRHRSLTDDEWMVLKNCLCARLAQSLVLGEYTYAQDPGNEYLLTTAENGWKLLNDFWKISSNEVICRWKEIIKTYE